MNLTFVAANLNGYFNRGGRAVVAKKTLENIENACGNPVDIYIFTETKDSYDKESGLSDFVLQQNSSHSDGFYILYEEKSRVRRGYAGVSVLVRNSLLAEKGNQFVGRISLGQFTNLNKWLETEAKLVFTLRNEDITTRFSDKLAHDDAPRLPIRYFQTDEEEIRFHEKHYIGNISEKYNFVLDLTGRIVVLQFRDFVLLAVYTMNSGARLNKLDLRTMLFDQYLLRLVQELETNFGPVILAGDLNIIRDERDIWNPEKNKHLAGFTTNEKISFENFLEVTEMKDTFRELHGDTIKYTFFSNRAVTTRADNKGFRLDYFFVSKHLISKVQESTVLENDEIIGVISDHRPIILRIAL